jgi:hypothetical protein
MKEIITKVTKAGHHPSNINRDEGFCFSNSWKPTIYTLKIQGKHPQMALLNRVLVSSGPAKDLCSFHSPTLFSTVQFLPTVSCITHISSVPLKCKEPLPVVHSVRTHKKHHTNLSNYLQYFLSTFFISVAIVFLHSLIPDMAVYGTNISRYTPFKKSNKNVH